jgi:STE24 endopeptidase
MIAYNALMRFLRWIILIIFTILAAVTFIPASPETINQARAYFSDEKIEHGIRFAGQRRALFWGGTFAQLGLMLWLAFGDGGRRFALWAKRLARGWWLPTLLIVGALFYLALAALALPFDAARWRLLVEWGLASRAFLDWLGEHLLALGITGVVEALAVLGLYALIRIWPRGWWLPAALGATALAAAVAWLLPVVISPLFNTFTPLRDTPWAAWEKPLRRIVEESGVPIEEVLVMDASRQSHHSNAYFTGFGATRRIVLYDNLLKKHTLPEIESILAHELGHWLHDHIVHGIALGGAAALVGFFILSRLLLWAQTSFGLESPSDPAGLPLVILCVFLGNWLALPVASAVSRHFERQADQAALDIAKQPEAFIAAEIKLVRDNIDNPAPAPWNVWLFATHPPAVERIEAAQRWRDNSAAQ